VYNRDFQNGFKIRAISYGKTEKSITGFVNPVSQSETGKAITKSVHKNTEVETCGHVQSVPFFELVRRFNSSLESVRESMEDELEATRVQ